MVSITVEYRTLPGTAAASGRAGNHVVIADRPEGKAGGMGLGFNGGQLLALALGGCFCNDVHYTAYEMRETVVDVAVQVKLELDGEPLIATRAAMLVSCTLASGADPRELLDRAARRCTVANSLAAGVDVTIEAAWHAEAKRLVVLAQLQGRAQFSPYLSAPADPEPPVARLPSHVMATIAGRHALQSRAETVGWAHRWSNKLTLPARASGRRPHRHATNPRANSCRQNPVAVPAADEAWERAAAPESTDEKALAAASKDVDTLCCRFAGVSGAKSLTRIIAAANLSK